MRYNTKKSLLRFCGSAVLCGAMMQGGAAQQTGQSAATLVYDVEMDTRAQQVLWHHVLYDRGKFRNEIIFPTSHLKKPVYAVIYDASKPYIAWSCGFDGAREAFPMPSSCHYAVNVVAGRDGVEATRQHYHLPQHFRIYPIKDKPPRPSSPLKTKSDFPELTGVAVGSENVAGYVCQIYQSNMAQQVETSRDGVPGTRIVPQTHEVRAWVEPRTGLVLRLEERQVAASTSPVPPRASGYVVKKLRLPLSIPPERFQLPPGTTANVARIFSDVKLPPGVKRVLPPAFAADIGMGMSF